MADENLTELGLSTSNAVEQVLRLAGVLDKYQDKLDNIGSASVTFSKKGKLASLAISELDSTLNTLNTKFQQTKSGLVIVGTGAEQATNRIKELTNAISQIREGSVNNKNAEAQAQAQAAAKKQLTDTFQGPNVGNASDAQLKRFQAAVRGVTEEMGRQKLTLSDLDAIFKKVADGTITLTTAEERVAQKFRDIQSAAGEFGTVAQNAQNRATRAAQAQQRVLDQLDARLRKNSSEARNNAEANRAAALAATAFGSRISSATPTQVLQYNAALNQALNLLNQGKVSAANFATALQRIASGTPNATLTGPLAQLQQHLNTAANSFNTLGKSGATAGQNVLLSWQGVIRMFESQLLFHLFSQLQQGFAGSVQSAQEFSQKIALIQTISQDSGVSYHQWAEGIREVSDALGTPLIDTAAASYDLLSNQVTRGAETMNVLRTAVEFGRTTNASAEDSVNLLSSAINSFHLGADGADRAARTFFTTIDLGRVTASELANSFGRSGVLAENLGVSLEELQAGISSMTRAGIKGNESYTLLNNVFLKLIKPTEELQKWLKSIGFETGQDAVQALGFTGVLKLLSKEFDGNTAKVAKFFDEMKGARGALNLTGKGLQEFLGDLEKIKSSNTNYDLAKQLVGDSAGQKFQVELNKIKNYFINDFGSSILKGIVNLSDTFGGLASTIKSLSNSFLLLALATTVFYAVQKFSALTIAANAFFTAILKGQTIYEVLTIAAARFGLAATAGWAGLPVLIGIAAGALAAYFAVLQQGDRASYEHFKETEGTFRDQQQKLVDTDKAANEKRYQNLTDSLTRSKAAFLGYFAELRVEYDRVGEAIKAKQDGIAQSLGNTFDVLKGILHKGITEMENEAKTASDNIKKGQDFKVDTKKDAEKGLFERNLNAAQQVKDYATEIDLVNRRLAQLEKAKIAAFNARDISGANEAFQEQLRVVKSISAEVQKVPIFKVRTTSTVTQKDGEKPSITSRTRAVNGTENQPIIQRANLEGTITLMLKEQLKLTDKFIANEAVLRDAAAKRAEQAKKDVLDLEDNFKKLQEFSVLDKKGNVKDEFQGDDGRAKALEQFSGLQKAVTDGLSKSGAAIPAQVAVLAAFQDQFLKLRELLSQQKKNLTDQVANLSGVDKLSEAENKLKAAFEGAGTAAGTIRSEINKSEQSAANLRAEILAITALLAEQNKGGFGGNLTNKGIRDFGGQIDKVTKEATTGDPAAAAASVQLLLDKLQKLQQFSGQDILRKILHAGNPNDPNDPAVTIFAGLAKIQAKVQELSALKIKLEVDNTNLKSIEFQLAKLEQQIAEYPTKFKNIGTSAADAGAAIQTGIDPGIAAFQTFNNQLDRAITKLQEVQRLQAGGAGAAPEVESKSHGGRVGYFSDGAFLSDFLSGKYATGTDRIPAMLTRGEYVVNAGSTKQFLPLLRAINAGKLTAQGANQGTSVGDINITVQGGSSADGTIKNIASGLRRGLRTGSIRPF